MRKSTGGTWTPSKIENFDNPDKGIICTECHRRIPFKEIDIDYEVRSGDIYRLWWCSRCGTMLREDNLSDLMLQYELERDPFGES